MAPDCIIVPISLLPVGAGHRRPKPDERYWATVRTDRYRYP